MHALYATDVSASQTRRHAAINAAAGHVNAGLLHRLFVSMPPTSDVICAALHFARCTHLDADDNAGTPTGRWSGPGARPEQTDRPREQLTNGAMSFESLLYARAPQNSS